MALGRPIVCSGTEISVELLRAVVASFDGPNAPPPAAEGGLATPLPQAPVGDDDMDVSAMPSDDSPAGDSAALEPPASFGEEGSAEVVGEPTPMAEVRLSGTYEVAYYKCK